MRYSRRFRRDFGPSSGCRHLLPACGEKATRGSLSGFISSSGRGLLVPFPPAGRGLLHVSFNRIRLKDKNMQQIKVLQRPLRVS
ncbi:hypothetical protein GOA63_07925 [Sinorhizobium meliloti]|nr:hypothetical protein [Sinorhizobium meliloti]MDX0187379.1 hypothetical protein [Sinorhizobium meliloti]MQV06817.1 hypothetical protein [Sinorhizobium meliloti]MQV60075.1 hypothetical protein [Sinorhizobium meliloti]